MKLLKLTVYLILPLAFATTSSHAALYKWVDENGKVHYSDKAPDDQVKTDVVPVEQDAGTDATGAGNPSARAIIRPYEKTARRLHLLDTLMIWKRESEIEKTTRVGAYYAGKACTSRGAMKMPDVLIHQKNLFPSERDLSYRIRKVINGLDYESERTEKYDLIQRLSKSGGLSLHSEIIEMDFHTCASNLRSSERLNPMLKVSTGRFNKHRIRLTIKWTLKADRDQRVVYETTTEGRYNGWRKTSSPQRALLDATESAVLNLFTDKDFISRILIEEESFDLETASISEVEPIRSSGNLKNRELFVSINEDNWTRKLKPAQPLGNLLFGSNCGASKPYTQRDASDRKIQYLPDARRANDLIIKNVRALGYTINPADNLSDGILNGGYSLQAELVKVSHDACAPSLSASNKFKPIDKLNARYLSRRRSQVQIKWTLKSDANRNTLYETVTEVAAGTLLTDSSSTEVMESLVAMASQRLFADRSFVARLKIEKSDTQLASEPFGNAPLSVSGIVNPNRNSERQIFIVTNDDPWRAISTDKVIGYYSYGDECTPYKGRRWPQAVNDHASLFLRAGDVANAQSKAIKSLAYKYQVTDQYNVVNMKRKLGGYSLHFDIFDIRYDSCAPNESESAILKNRKISSSNYKRHRAKVSILWKLVGEDPAKPLFETSTSGVADNWLINSNGKKVLSVAIENATSSLFAEQAFIDQLTAAEKEGESLFSGLFSMFSSDDPEDSDDEVSAGSQKSYTIKAHTAQALSEMNTLKMMMLEHYYSGGNWPDGLTDMGLSESMFHASKTISHVNIQADGSIVAELKELVGDDKILKLTPVEDTGGFGVSRWDCSSNIVRHALVSACESF